MPSWTIDNAPENKSRPTVSPLARASDLHAEQPFAPILLLEVAVAVAADVLRARYVAASGDLHAGEINEVITARILARDGDQLLETSATTVAASSLVSPASSPNNRF